MSITAPQPSIAERAEERPARVAFVTGGAGGLGAATCSALAARGARVVVADVNVTAADRVACRLGGPERALAIHCDVADAAAVDAAIGEAAARFGRLDVLVNNAGVIAPEPTATLSDDSWERLVGIHLGGALRCARAAYPHLKAAGGGAIVSIASIAAHVGTPLRASYCASKAGIEGLTRSLAVEWAPDGIRVNAVAPGYVLTPAVQGAIDRGVLDKDALFRRVPLGRFGEAREPAAAVAFLASDEASFITGQVVVVDGGLIVNGDW